jgi:hypothetical protein
MSERGLAPHQKMRYISQAHLNPTLLSYKNTEHYKVTLCNLKLKSIPRATEAETT